MFFPDYRDFPVPAEKKWISDLESTPQETFIEKEKIYFLYVHKVKQYRNIYKIKKKRVFINFICA